MKRLFIAIILILCSTNALAATTVTIDLIEPKLNPVTSQDSRPVYELLVPFSYYKFLEGSGKIDHPIWLRFRLKIDSDLTDSPRGFYRKTGNEGYEDFTSFVIEKNNLTENQDLIVRQGIKQPFDIYFNNFIGQSAMETQLEFGLPLTREILYQDRQDENGELCLTFTMSRHQQNIESRHRPFSLIVRPATFEITGEIVQRSTDAIGLQVMASKANVDLEVCCGKNTKRFKPDEELNKSYDFKVLTGNDSIGVAVRIRPVFSYDVHPGYIEKDTKYLVRKYVKEDTAKAFQDFSRETAQNPRPEPDEPPDGAEKKIPNLTGELREKVKSAVDKVCIVEDFTQEYGFQVKMRPETSIAEILNRFNKCFPKGYFQEISPRDVVVHNCKIENKIFLNKMRTGHGSGPSVVRHDGDIYDWRKAQYGVVFYLPAYEKPAE